MAIRTRRKIKTKKYTRNADLAVGRDVIGFTADVAGLQDLERMNKGLYGMFEGSGPFYHTIYGNIMDTKGFRVIEPVFPYRDLLKVYMMSTILRQCVDAMVTNIESYGTELEYIGPEGAQNGRAAKTEKKKLESLLATITTDGRPIQKHREDSRVDKEVLGARCFEVIRDLAGRVTGFDHVHTTGIRMTNPEKDETLFEMYDAKTGTSKIVSRKFRRFLQVAEDGDMTWFKELGDPRSINSRNGEVDNTLSIEDQATEIYYEGLYCPGTPCGVPRWAGAIASLLGAREAEMVNLNFFRDNAIPAMAVMVSGGALTEESFDKIRSYIEGVRGAHSMNRIVVLEAVSDGAEAASVDGSLPAPKIDLKPMLSERQHEGLFQNYVKEGERKGRSAFRLPPVYIGSAEEYNRASAFASVLTAEQQVFVPERIAWDEMFETVVLSTHGFKYWRSRSRGPGMQDPAEVARVVNSLAREGAMTPNAAIKLANRYLDADLEIITEEWGDQPMAITMQYVKAGKEIPGLDYFVEQVEEAVPEGEDKPLNLADANLPLRKQVRQMLDAIANRLEDELEETVQSIVSKREAEEYDE